MMISDEERKILRKVALEAAARAMGLRASAPSVIDSASPLARPVPVFLTWKRDGRSRGRSGTAVAERALVVEVEEHAVTALLHDPRFPPAAVKELSRYVPEISVLYSFEEIPGAEGLLPGTHGVVVEKGKRRGVVLPQDGVEFAWDGARILAQACLRAGLPEESWQAPGRPRLLRFTADVF